MRTPSPCRLPTRPWFPGMLFLVLLSCESASPGADHVPASLALVTAPGAAAFAGEALAPQPVVEVRDAEGEPVRAAGMAVVVSASRGTLSGTTSVETDDQGRATFTDLVLNGAEGPAELRFACCDLAPTTHALSLSFGGNLIAHASEGTVIARAGTVISPGPAVFVTDNRAHPVGGALVRFTVDGRGSIPLADVVTDESGRAELPSYAFGETPGAAIVTAALDGSQRHVRFVMQSTVSGQVTLLDDGVLYVGEVNQEFIVPPVQVMDGGAPVAGLEVRYHLLNALPGPTTLTAVTDAAGRTTAMEIGLFTPKGLQLIDVFVPGYMPAPLRLRVIADHPPFRLVWDTAWDVVPSEEEGTYGWVRVLNRLDEPVPAVPLQLTSAPGAGSFYFFNDLSTAGAGIESDDLGYAGIFWQVPVGQGAYQLEVSASRHVANPVTLTAARVE